jgi:predicted nucleic-acid-binding protein
MLGIDTNVLVRFLTRDDPEQFDRAQKLIRREASRGEPVFVSHLVLMETEWVLRSRYKLAKADILGAFSELLSSIDLAIEEESSIEEALYVWKDSAAQFADCMIGAHYRHCHCTNTASFDTAALKLPGFVAV